MSETPASSSGASAPPNDADLLQSALVAFNGQKFQQCVDTLDQITVTQANETKIAHNRAVALFYASQLRDCDAFRSQLDALLPVQACSEPVPITDGDPVACDPLKINDTSMLTLYFNRAVVLFHTRQPRAALRILSALMPHLGEMDDALAQRSGLLTIHLLLNGHQSSEALQLIENLHARMRLTAPETLPADDDYDDDDDRTMASADGKAAARSAKSGYGEAFRRMFLLYRMRCTVMTGRTLMIASEDTSEMSVLRAHQFYNGIDYQMAAKELSKPFVNARATLEANGEDHNTIIANDMGIVHFHVRHYAMAVRFFQHALTFEQNAQDSLGPAMPRTMHCVSASKRPDILYNLGISMLHLQRPQEAFECLLVVLEHYQRNPRAWLRLAEACIMVHTQRAQKSEPKSLVHSTFGVGIQQKHLMHPHQFVRLAEEPVSFSNPNTSLEFASLCLRNAYDLCELLAAKLAPAASSASASAVDGDGGAAASASGSSEQKGRAFADCQPSKPLTESAFRNLRLAVLAASAYVQLTLGEYQLALEYARKLSTMDALPDAYAVLARLYCAEALIMLDRFFEARKYLDVKFMQSLKPDDFIHRGSPGWPVNSVEAAQAILTYNLAVNYMHNGDSDIARTVLKTCVNHPLTMHRAKAAYLYMEMRTGNVDQCLSLVRNELNFKFK